MLQWFSVIKIEIELEHVHTWFTEKAELPAFRVHGDDLAQLVFTYASLMCDAWHLKLSGSRRDVRIET